MDMLFNDAAEGDIIQIIREYNVNLLYPEDIEKQISKSYTYPAN